jgi:hypothetical protein
VNLAVSRVEENTDETDINGSTRIGAKRVKFRESRLAQVSYCRFATLTPNPRNPLVFVFIRVLQASIFGDAQYFERHCERSEAIQPSVRRPWIASLRSQ